MTLNPYKRGVERGRREAVDHLRVKAQLHHGQVGDARRRGVLNSAADEIRDGREASR